LLTRYAPPGVLINERMQILEFRGRTGAYLELAPGDPSGDIVTMVREGLRSPLLTAIARAKEEMAPARIPSVRVEQDGETKMCDLVVAPLATVPSGTDLLFTVMFEPTTRGAASQGGEDENAPTCEDVRVLVAEHDRTTRALRSANHDLKSRNAELECLNSDLRRRMAGGCAPRLRSRARRSEG
jgi:two-component system CheB/CheR fusion protein